MECEYCGQEDADTDIEGKWYHKDCYIRYKSGVEKIKFQEYLPFINCCSVIIIFIVLIWLIVKLQPILKGLP